MGRFGEEARLSGTVVVVRPSGAVIADGDTGG